MSTNFWSLSDNSDAKTTTGAFETGGGTIEPIPANTSCLAAIDEAKLDDYNGDQYISLRWTVLQPTAYANRKIFQKVRVWESDPKKADKAKRMLAAIDANAGGKLIAAGKEPNDASLTAALVNKPMVIKLQVWEITKEDGTTGKGNWVCAVSPRSAAQPAQPSVVASDAPATQPQTQPQATAASLGVSFDDDIPF